MQIMMEYMWTVIFNRVEIESLNKMAFLKMSTHQAHNSRNTIYNVLTGWFLICENSVNRDLHGTHRARSIRYRKTATFNEKDIHKFFNFIGNFNTSGSGSNGKHPGDKNWVASDKMKVFHSELDVTKTTGWFWSKTRFLWKNFDKKKIRLVFLDYGEWTT